MRKDFILYLDMVSSSSYTADELIGNNEKVLQILARVLDERSIDVDRRYINFTGDGFVCVVKNDGTPEIENYNKLIKGCVDLYSKCSIGHSIAIRLAAHVGDNHWGQIGSGILSVDLNTPYGEPMIQCARLLSAAEDNNFVLSNALVSIAGEFNSVRATFPGAVFIKHKITTKDKDGEGQRKTVDAYNVFLLNSAMGNPFYESTASAHR
jgi:hypothetical protein